MKYIKLFIIIVFAFGYTSLYAQNRWSSKYVFYGKNGKLECLPDSPDNVIPDFSNVGYRYGDEAIPGIPVQAIVEPAEGDALSVIQAAIESLQNIEPDENGFRSAVLIKSGTYEVDGIIRINQSGIVLRGEGNNEQRTRIIATALVKSYLIQVGVTSNLNVIQASEVYISEQYVIVGRKFVVVESAASFATGDQISLYRPGKQNWISDIQMDQIPPRPDGGKVVQWSPSTYNFHFERTITDIQGDTIHFRNPVVMAMVKKYGGGKVYKATRQRTQKIDVEYMLLTPIRIMPGMQ